ncbi:adenylate isopentenyltransferase-like [Salvia miltiorrhiza]|uniref:adenylate isopentenyltransferase-like n=1 Tax=Salvia miltiorrhiza TaxID=226208 RepID=UPI0025ABC05B|nr:adenylate isopentenyltransferase-like [Salvia miltiorrhiza]
MRANSSRQKCRTIVLNNSSSIPHSLVIRCGSLSLQRHSHCLVFLMRRLSSFFLKSHHFPYKTLSLPPRRPHMSSRPRKIVVVMGPTGCGKTKLSIDLISRFFPSSEIINSDKIQVYRGLDITTNKIPLPDRRNVRHHLLGDFDPSDSHPEFTPSDFRSAASQAVSQILARRRIPFIVGGSNSLIYALLANKFNPDCDVFTQADSAFCKEQRYECCFIYVDVALPVLNQYLIKRVDDMLESGMFEELAAYFASPESESVRESGLRKAIGVPEFEGYFRRFKGEGWRSGDDDVEKKEVYEEAVGAIKDNTCQLAKRQVEKILRLRDSAGWDLKRVETTPALRAAVDGAGGRRVAEIWERQVVEPSVKIVKHFLME